MLILILVACLTLSWSVTCVRINLPTLLASPKQGRIRYNICQKDKTDQCKCSRLMNVGMPASIIRMSFLSLSFYFLKKFQSNERASKILIQRYFSLPFQVTTTNKPLKIKESVLSNQFYQL